MRFEQSQRRIGKDKEDVNYLYQKLRSVQVM